MAESPSTAVPGDVRLSRRDVVLLVVLVLWLPFWRFFIAEAGGFDLHVDEAQYWEWSRRLDWSYYSKGPLVAWLIALGTALFGHGEWQVRLFSWLAHDVLLVLLFCFARQFWQCRRAGWWAVALGLTTPLFFPLGQVMTTDVFLFVCGTWALWAAWRALYRGQGAAWDEVGAAIGIGGRWFLGGGVAGRIVCRCGRGGSRRRQRKAGRPLRHRRACRLREERGHRSAFLLVGSSRRGKRLRAALAVLAHVGRRFALEPRGQPCTTVSGAVIA